MTAAPRWRAHLPALALAGAFFLTAVLALHAHRAATPVLAVAGLVVPALAWLRGSRPRPDRTIGLLFLAVLTWAALGLAWSIDAAAGLDLLPRVAYLLLAGVMMTAAAAGLPAPDARIAGRGLVAGMAVGAALLLVEAASGGDIKALLSDKKSPVIALKAGSTILALLLWPALAILVDGGRRRTAIVLAAAVAIPLAILDGRAAFVAVAAGAVAFAVAWPAPRTAAVALSAIAVVGILSAPFLILQVAYPWLGGINGGGGGGGGGELLPFSGRHRLEIWRFAAERILEQPFAGWGLNVSRVFPGADRILDPASGAMQMPLHPHNAALQWWLELGLPGALAGAAFVALLARASIRLPTPATRAAAAALLASGLVVSMLSYGAWQNWWLSAMGLAAAAMATAGRTHTRS